MVNPPADPALHAVSDAAVPSGTAARVTFSHVLAVGEFRVLWAAQLQSLVGDQLARVAMTVLVYDRTRSPFLTALTYAVTFLPWVIGGVALSGLADRLPRRQVMIACDLARMALVCLMVVVGLARSAVALWVMVALLFAVTLLDSPFKSARSALVADVLQGEEYVAGTALTQMTMQSGLVVGFAVGGLVVAALGARLALATDAVTFAVSAALLALFVQSRPAAAGPAASPAVTWSGMAAGMRMVFGDPTLRTLVLFGWLVAFYVVPMGLAAPYAASFHGLPLAVGTGLVFAAVPFGTAVGAFLLSRMVAPERRRAWMGPLAVGSCAVLMLCWARPGLPASLAIFVAAGVFAGYQVTANASFVAAVPPHHRGQAFGLANGGMQVLQGLWLVGAGSAASALTPAPAIAISGAVGALIASFLVLQGHR
ncbi:MAG TPA: MFS transporter [Streptosporangiaceae bacterium]|nr:MFS transporter [Streptosporangiaceae bacterium]